MAWDFMRPSPSRQPAWCNPCASGSRAEGAHTRVSLGGKRVAIGWRSVGSRGSAPAVTGRRWLSPSTSFSGASGPALAVHPGSNTRPDGASGRGDRRRQNNERPLVPGLLEPALQRRSETAVLDLPEHRLDHRLPFSVERHPTECVEAIAHDLPHRPRGGAKRKCRRSVSFAPGCDERRDVARQRGPHVGERACEHRRVVGVWGRGCPEQARAVSARRCSSRPSRLGDTRVQAGEVEGRAAIGSRAARAGASEWLRRWSGTGPRTPVPRRSGGLRCGLTARRSRQRRVHRPPRSGRRRDGPRSGRAPRTRCRPSRAR
jgi:hypothetical protein